MDIFSIILIIIGAYLISLPFISTTKNTKSSIILQYIPFLSGLYCIFYALKTSGIIIVSK